MGLDLGPGAGDFVVLDLMGELDDFVEDQRYQVPDIGLAGARINPEQAAVGVALKIRIDGIGEPPLFPHFLE